MDTDHVVETYSWKLQVPAPPRLQEIGARNAFEAVVDMDHRTQVSSNDLEVNGTYRSIIKLKIAWQGAVKKRVWATGWLIRDDIVITAAHVVYQTDTFATEVRAHVGDNGADSIQGLQRRYGSRVVIPCAWQDSQEVVHDFAFVLLQGPFDHVVPLPYEPTPSAGLNDIGVVGYPADKPGKQMYMEFRQVDCSLFEEGQPLAYGISTFRGKCKG
ncbi:hypothetical protein DBV05_g2525 [Lasiodiplodia theobromae]|uniref:Peptidase S1 domain-containing protein n=1 Tax=Lasiodiplodia theobromae TaxID=45133 RepID=A0A5N5DM72_9PEZI|nr:hypothetical protein DBV05_g2525 [Lasiodiplodia theobromae]